MLKLFRHYLRRIPFVNFMGRNVLKWGISMGSKKAIQLAEYWPVWGLVRCRFNGIQFRMLSHCDDPHVNYFYYQTKYSESYQLSLFLKLAAKCHTIFDIGANSGHYSILSAISGPQSRIYAFEPYLPNYERLQWNVNANQLKSIQCINIALGRANGSLTLSVPAMGGISEVVSANAKFPQTIYPGTKWMEIAVEQRTVDSFVAEANLSPDLMKLDVETFEKQVLEGAKQSIQQFRPVIFCEIFKLDSDWWTEWLKESNYQLAGIADNELKFPESVSENLNYGNYILFPCEKLKESLEILNA